MPYTTPPDYDGPRLTPEQQALVMKGVPVVRGSPVTQRAVPGADRDDLIQESCLALCNAVRSYDESRAKWETLAYTVTHNTVCRMARDQQFRRRVWEPWPEADDGYEHQGPQARDDHGTLLTAWCSDEMRLLRSKLLMKWRVILYLLVVEGITEVEVGRLFGVTHRRISAIKLRAVDRMKRVTPSPRFR